jgi:crossover junction endodeoxyribonuclease RuvC
MLILGIDPGTARTGYAVLELKKTPRLIATDVITTPAGVDMHKRLKILYRELNEIVDKYSPDTMVVERLFFNTNVKTAISVGQSRGISLLVAANKDLNLFEYTALQAKLAITGYGRSDKKEVQEGVKKFLKLDGVVKSDDANDAVAIALCYCIKEFAPLVHAVKVRQKS